MFLDRDGVLNKVRMKGDVPCPPADLSDLEILPNVPEALLSLRQAGFRLIVVTNQPDVARGTTPRESVEAINQYLLSHLPLDSVEVCYHDDADHCDCRKPRPGMLTGAAERYGIDVTSSFMVGDRWRDMEAGRLAGCSTILVGVGYKEGVRGEPDKAASSLLEAAQWIIQQHTSRNIRS
ncbi:D-alpha,beta-D-heptose 1,7-bisphosphate phosphatase [Skermanella stibiiresistens SB22]|uniref:D,D-heptose 1,7-bisphosphate phosphatase n=1 Tax=Skermanella stibiiresistens SB22 TaxID=1385369 RepID=W9HCS7_9PROT|nr:HAD family hydrolase [Skermanella stibiiresistens]EWY42541.1 D-alpha,beta-D-heptose 1,7-bisphosphate phosphatase [Skermanella stibiiresistens SB22]